MTANTPIIKPRKPFWGLLRRQECWRLSWRGWGVLWLIGLALLLIATKTVQPFLAVTAPIPAEAMIVEGWQPDYALTQIIEEFKQHGYRKLYVTGGPLDQGSFLSEYKTYAELGAASLTRMGMNPNDVQAVPAAPVRKDRTYASALELKRWLQSQGSAATNFNLVSMDVHARRSHLLFQQAFGASAEVGIISIPSRDYVAREWWKSSEGFRTVTGEIIAYLYARVLFQPDKD
jgi:hypothetical protein